MKFTVSPQMINLRLTNGIENPTPAVHKGASSPIPVARPATGTAARNRSLDSRMDALSLQSHSPAALPATGTALADPHHHSPHAGSRSQSLPTIDRWPFEIDMPHPAPPPRVDNAIDAEAADAWVNAHDPSCRAVARAIVRNVQHLDMQKLMAGVGESVKAFEANLPPDEPYIALVEPKRGSGWIFQLARPMLTRQPKIVGDVGQVSKFVKSLSPSNPLPLHILYPDDASYSGEQLYERVVWDIALKLDHLVQTQLTVHVICPFMTNLALDKVKPEALRQDLPNNIIVKIAGQPGRLSTVLDLANEGKITPTELAMFRKMYPDAGKSTSFNADPLGGLTLAYMAHKVPDGWSCLTPVLRNGEVRNEQGSLTTQTAYNFVPKTTPPYRNTKDW